MLAPITSLSSTNSTTPASNPINVKSLKKQANTLGVDESILKKEIIATIQTPESSTSPSGSINPAFMTKLNNIDMNVSVNT